MVYAHGHGEGFNARMGCGKLLQQWSENMLVVLLLLILLTLHQGKGGCGGYENSGAGSED